MLLASAFSQDFARERVHLEDWGRPVLMLGGEMDGQIPWFSYASYAAQVGRPSRALRAVLGLAGVTSVTMSDNHP